MLVGRSIIAFPHHPEGRLEWTQNEFKRGFNSSQLKYLLAISTLLINRVYEDILT
jgi:hypothetical protein